jgi:ketosteroid isomerase-like protein
MPPLTREQWRAGCWSGDVAGERGVDPPRLSGVYDRDLDAVLAGLHDEVEAFPRLAAVEGGYRGHDGIRRWWAQLLGAFPDFHVEILEVRDLGEFIVLALRLRGRGAESDTPVDAAVWHVNQFRDGKVIRWRVYTSESEALEAVRLRE